jgi:hypothetical protein
MKNYQCGFRRSLRCKRREIDPQIPLRDGWWVLTRDIQGLSQQIKAV